MRKIFVAAIVLGVFLGLMEDAARTQEFTPDWNLEFHRGPVIGPASMVGRGGTAIGMAEGSASQGQNPAAVANHSAQNGAHGFDWDAAIDWLNVSLGSNDIENNGRVGGGDQVQFLNLAGNLLFGRFGVGLELRTQKFEVKSIEPTAPFAAATYSALAGGLTLGYNFLDGDLIVATEVNVPSVTIALSDYRGNGGQEGEDVAFKLGGGGWTLGVLWRPTDWPVRVGLTAQQVITTKLEEAPGSGLAAADVQGLTIPHQVVVPWSLGLGVVYSLGPRTLNPRQDFGHETPPRQSFRAPLWREYWLFAVDVVFTGPTPHASGIEAWLANEVERAGEHPTVSVRLGAESEFWPGFMRARVGSYYEPSRFAGVSGRVHGTGGIDVQLFSWLWDWRLSVGVDGARNYVNTMVSVGFWD